MDPAPEREILVLDWEWTAVRFFWTERGDAVVRIDCDDPYYNHDWTLTPEQADALLRFVTAGRAADRG